MLRLLSQRNTTVHRKWQSSCSETARLMLKFPKANKQTPTSTVNNSRNTCTVWPTTCALRLTHTQEHVVLQLRQAIFTRSIRSDGHRMAKQCNSQQTPLEIPTSTVNDLTETVNVHTIPSKEWCTNTAQSAPNPCHPCASLRVTRPHLTTRSHESWGREGE